MIWTTVGYRLFTYAAVSALVGSRIYHGQIPETQSTLPVINYFRVSNEPIINGWAERARYQISCRDNSPGDCETLAFAVFDAFNNLEETTINGFDIDDSEIITQSMLIEENGIYHIPIDVYLSYKIV